VADLGDQTTDATIWSEDRTKSVDVMTDTLGKNRLLTEGTVTIANNESPTKYQLKTDYDATGDTITSAADAVLFSYTGDGTLNFVAVTNATSSNYEIAIEIDGTERLRITMNNLGSVLGLISGSTPFWTETANKAFRFRPYEGVGFTTGFRILAKATGANTTVTHFTMFKERVE
jgi:hypothetical protein